jgi:hypothetical protein
MGKALLSRLLLTSISNAQSLFRAGVATVDISPTELPRIIAGGFLEGRGEKMADKLFVFNGNAASQIVRGKTIVEPGSWNDVKLERICSRVKVTLNGKVEIDTEPPVTKPGAKDLFFGRRCDDFAPLEGEFEKVGSSVKLVRRWRNDGRRAG